MSTETLHLSEATPTAAVEPSADDFCRDPLATFDRRLEAMGRGEGVESFWIDRSKGRRLLCVADPAAAKAVLANADGLYEETSDFFHTSRGPFGPRELQLQLGRDARRLLTRHAAERHDALEETIDRTLGPSSVWPDAGNRLIHRHFRDVLVTPERADTLGPLLDEILTHGVFAGARERRSWLRRVLFRRRVFRAFEREIERRAEERAAKRAEEPRDLFDVLARGVDAGARPSDLGELYLPFDFAVVSSVGFTLAWALRLLGEHPSDEPSDHVVREALRLWPIAWQTERHPAERHRLAGETVEPGDAILVSAYVAHRHPGHWTDAGAFRPERWSERRLGPTAAYFPFGWGPHTCAAASLSLEIARDTLDVFRRRRFSIRSLSERPFTGPSLAPPRFRLDLHPRPPTALEGGDSRGETQEGAPIGPGDAHAGLQLRPGLLAHLQPSVTASDDRPKDGIRRPSADRPSTTSAPVLEAHPAPPLDALCPFHRDGADAGEALGGLAVLDSRAARALDTANYDGALLGDRLIDTLRGRTSPPVAWSTVRGAWARVQQRLVAPEPTAELETRLRRGITRHLDGPPTDLALVIQDVFSRALLPTVVAGLSPRDLRRVERDQAMRIERMMDLDAPPLGPLGLARSGVVQLGVTRVLRRLFRRRARGLEPRRIDFADPLVDLLPALGLSRATDAVAAVLSAIAGPPGAVASCLLLELSLRPEWAARVADEQASIDADAYRTDARRSAPTTYRFVQETLRCWSSPTLVTREARRPLAYGDRALAEGDVYHLSLFFAHRRADDWPEPDRFEPDRWLPGSSLAPRRSGASAPFGWPPTSCIGAAVGLDALMLLARLFTLDYRLEVDDLTTARVVCTTISRAVGFEGSIVRR